MNKALDKSLKDVDKQVKKMQPAIERVTAESIEATAKAVAQTAAVLQSEEFKQKIKAAVDRQAEIARIAPVAFMSVPRAEEKSGSFVVKGVPKVTVQAKGCAVDVKGWDKSEVQYRVVQFSDPRRVVGLAVTESHTDSAVNINVNDRDAAAPRPVFPAQSVRVEIYVPRRSNLKITTDGGIRLDGVSGDIELNGGDESINVRDADGSMRVSSSDGRIRVVGFKGDIVANSSDGMINLEGDFKNLIANANDGAITLTLPEDANANLDASCDQVHGEGIAVTRTGRDESLSHYRIGSGGTTFQVRTGGEIRVRSSGLLAARM